MSAQTHPKLSLHQPTGYRIIVQGTLSEDWNDYFSGFTVISRPEASPTGLTILTGTIIDQPKLLGVLNNLYTLGLPLLQVEWLAHSDHLEA